MDVPRKSTRKRRRRPYTGGGAASLALVTFTLSGPERRGSAVA